LFANDLAHVMNPNVREYRIIFQYFTMLFFIVYFPKLCRQSLCFNDCPPPHNKLKKILSHWKRLKCHTIVNIIKKFAFTSRLITLNTYVIFSIVEQFVHVFSRNYYYTTKELQSNLCKIVFVVDRWSLAQVWLFLRTLV
jgi:hypothetical protein